MIKFDNREIKKASLIVQRFKQIKTKHNVFYNMCFCILVPQTKFKIVFETIELLKNAQFFFKSINKEELLDVISSIRFKSRKFDYLLQAKLGFEQFYKELILILESERDTRVIRKFVVGRIKGMGLKASSHFLRNIGIEDLAIVDSHILQYFGYKDKKIDYFKVEDQIRDRAKNLGISIAVYDALIWGQKSGTNYDKFIY